MLLALPVLFAAFVRVTTAAAAAENPPAAFDQTQLAPSTPRIFKSPAPHVDERRSNPLAALLEIRGVDTRAEQACPAGYGQCKSYAGKCCPVGGACCSSSSMLSFSKICSKIFEPDIGCFRV